MPPPPQTKEGFFNIYFEEIDSTLAGLILAPHCYMCDKLLELRDTVVTFRIRGISHRFCLDCYDQLAIGMGIFNSHYDTMLVHSSGLQ